MSWVCCLWLWRSDWRNDEPAVFELNTQAALRFESGLFEPTPDEANARRGQRRGRTGWNDVSGDNHGFESGAGESAGLRELPD